MPICKPEQPHFASTTERAVWGRLRAQLGPTDLLIANQRITDHKKDHEADLVIAIDGVGIVCVEVKGGEVWHEQGTWWQGQPGGGAARIDPVAQALGSCYALRQYVEADPRWTQGRVYWDHMVVLPHTAIADDFAHPTCPRLQICGRDDLDRLGEAVNKLLVTRSHGHRALTFDGIEQLMEVLTGRGLPQRDVVARALAHADSATALTETQSVILDAITLLNRVEVRGGAGSGKTFLALEQARKLAQAGKRVAVICYSHGLASYLKRLTGEWSRKHRPAYVGEFHALGVQWGADSGPDESLRTEETVHFWEHALPSQMAELAAQLPPGKRFDAIVVDEAQDFADAWWEPVLAALHDEATSGLYLFSDEGQRVFDRQGTPPVPLVPLVLDQNLRNTKQIADVFVPLVGQRMRLRGGDGPKVDFVPCAAADAISAADDQVDVLMEAGWRPQDLALLTTGSRHPEQKSRQDEGHTAYWDSFWDEDQVFYGHVLGFKGLERSAVVLAVNEREAQDRSRERLYVGLSRARDQLVVCGDPDIIRAVGGPELSRKLGLDQYRPQGRRA